jgi:hypothetical protein
VAVEETRRYDGEVENITPRALPSDCRDEERAFLQEFKDYVVDLVKECRQRFPYRQTIRWSIEYGNNNQHSLHILVKPSHS